MYYQESRVQVIVNSLLAVGKRQFFSAEKYLHMEIRTFVLMVAKKYKVPYPKVLSKDIIPGHFIAYFGLMGCVLESC